ncbi:hypothetical protein SKAU_G00040520 [Synaphobranchus kaupii]|uniref:C2 domain-containing protein n=1 Tax=Synaphobranchus kaupii TaxID=118154 RepID=A0A9Q1J8T1_SYNKA|nr:hypothetical protein SKAU_G00040520 [Synaphobranchus kaupii]
MSTSAQPPKRSPTTLHFTAQGTEAKLLAAILCDILSVVTMPGKLKAKIVAGRHLPVMDRASDLTDAFVEVKFGTTTFKTDVCPKSLNPQWNSEWFKFEVDDEDLQDEPLQITVLDHDTYSANDAIGKVYIDIDPLLSNEAATVISGWFPIYDTIHGIRGEINILVKVDLFNDLNRFRQSSCGVKFFCTTSIPRCYRAAMVHGFVEELVVNEDPEYQWIDRIRTPRASNEARQRLISLMSGELQRKIGLKVLEMGGNAVLSNPSTVAPPACNSPSKDVRELPFSEDPNPNTHSSGPSTPMKTQTYSFSPSKSYSRQSSSSDTDLSLTPKTGMGSGGSAGKEGGPLKTLLRQQTQSALEQREFPFFTLTSFPAGFLIHVGGVVSAPVGQTPGPHPQSRRAGDTGRLVGGDSESTSICEEVCILSASGTASVLNPRFMQEGCLDGYSDPSRLSRQPAAFSAGSEKGEFDIFPQIKDSSAALGLEEPSPPSCGFCHIPYDELNMPFPAQLTYCYNCRRQKVPDVLFTTIDMPTEAAVTGKGCLIQARLCRLKKKAQGEVNATAISNLLPFMEYELHTQLMNKLKLRGMNALFGLRIQISVGENMLVGLASATGVYLTALPTPGGIQIAGKTPSDIAYEQHISNMQKKINDTIAKNKELFEVNPPKLFALDPEAFRGINTEMVEEVMGSPIPEPRQRTRLFRSHSESSDEASELDLSHGKKDAFVLEIDDTDAVEDIQSLLTDAATPAGFYSCNTETMPGIYNWTSGLQMFTSVRVFRLSNANLTNQGLNKIFNDLCENLLKSLYFKLRSMIPCCLCHLNFTVAVPEDELIQVAVTAVAMTFDKDQTQENWKLGADKTPMKAIAENEEQLQFPMELCTDSPSTNPFSSGRGTGLQESANAHATPRAASVDYSSFADRWSSWIELIRLKAQTMRRGSVKTTSSLEKASPLPEGRSRSLRSTRSYASSTVTVVKMTPLAFIPGTRIIKYLGIINMFFIRETTSLREEGGVSGFLHAFIAEVFAMVRAHVAALGGNAVVSYSMKECVFMENPNKNQAQCLINVSGDAVIFVRESESEVPPAQPQTSATQASSCGGNERQPLHRCRSLLPLGSFSANALPCAGGALRVCTCVGRGLEALHLRSASCRTGNRFIFTKEQRDERTPPPSKITALIKAANLSFIIQTE